MEGKKYIYFYGHTKGELKYFSQWYLGEFKVPKCIVKNLVNFDINANFLTLKSAEHWMMIMKALLFKDGDAYNKLIDPKMNPAGAKKIGRQVKNFDGKEWDKYKLLYVAIGNIYKFSSDLYDILQKTNNSLLVEASPTDKIWGIGISVENAEKGMKWKGQNLLGKALVIAREYLKKDKSGNINMELLETIRDNIVQQYEI